MGIQDYLIELGSFINFTLLPALFALAFLFFLVNVVRYFILSGHEEASRTQARNFALSSIAAFVILLSIWGIVNVIIASFGLGREGYVCPDYPHMNVWCIQMNRGDDYLPPAWESDGDGPF